MRTMPIPNAIAGPSFVASSILMDDYIVGQDLLVDLYDTTAATWTGPVSTYINPLTGCPESIVIGLSTEAAFNQQLFHICADASSETGWAIDAIPNAPGFYTNIYEVTTGVSAKGYVCALLAAGDADGKNRALYVTVRQPSGTWSYPRVVPDLSAPSIQGAELSAVYLQDPNFPFIVFNARRVDQGNWVQIQVEPESITANPSNYLDQNGANLGTGIAQTTPFLVNQYANLNWVAVMEVEPGAAHNSFTAAAFLQGSGNQATGSFTEVQLDQNLDLFRVLDVQPGATSTGCAILGQIDPGPNKTSRLFFCADVAADSTAVDTGIDLPNYTSIQSGRLFQTPDGRTHLLLLIVDDTQSALWSMSQKADKSGWLPAVPLLDDVSAFDIDNSRGFADTFIAVAASTQQVQVASYNANAMIWKPRFVRRSLEDLSQKASSLSTYRVRGQLLDAYGQPMALETVDLAASRSIMMWMGGQGLWLPSTATSKTVPVQTDAQGFVTFAIHATDVASPSVTVFYQGTALLTVAPDQDVRGYLAGTGTLQGKSSLSDSMNGTTPIVDSFGKTQATFCPKATDGNGPKIAQTINKVVSSKNGDGATLTGLTLDLRGLKPGGSGHVVLQLAKTREEFEAHRQALHGPERLENFLVDLADFAWSGIRTGLIDLEHVAVDFEQEVVQFASDALQALGNLFQIALDDIEHALALVEALINTLETAIEDFIDFLKALFDWEDIVNTKNYIEQHLLTGLTTSPTIFDQVLGKLRTEVDHIMGILKQDAEAVIQDLLNAIEPGTTVNTKTAAFKQPVTPPPNAAMKAGYRLGDGTGASLDTVHQSPHANWFIDRVTGSGGGLLSVITPSNNLPEDLLDDIISAITSANLSDDVSKLFSDFGSLFDVDSNSDFATQEVAKFIQLLGDLEILSLDVLQAVLDALISTAQTVADDGINNLLNAEIEVSILGPILADILGGDGGISIKELLLWVLALAITIAYKIITGNEHGPVQTTEAGTLGATDDDTTWIIGVIAVLIGGLIETIVDVLPKEPPADVEWISSILGIIAKVVTFDEEKFNGPSHYASIYGISMGVLALNVGGLILRANGQERIVRFYGEEVGPIVLTFLGEIQLILNIDDYNSNNKTLGETLTGALACAPKYTNFLNLFKNPWCIVAKVFIGLAAMIVETLEAAEHE